jgi:hypothetical protein
MNDSLSSTLGHLHAQIYWLHDAEKFAELAAAAAQVYKHLGYDSHIAKIVGRLISEAYQLSDPADLAYKAGDFDSELQFYQQVKDKLVQVETHLGLPESIAEHQMKWWIYFRHKQKFLVILHLFLQHFKSLGWLNLIPAIQVTYYLIQAGKIHKLRDVEMTSQYTTHYWHILLKIQPQQYPYLG